MARLDPFVDVLLRERADQLYLLPDEPVTLIKDGKPRKVSKQPLPDAHIYALLVEVAPPESSDKIDQQSESGNCQGDDRQESCSSAGNCQADEQTVITQLSRP